MPVQDAVGSAKSLQRRQGDGQRPDGETESAGAGWRRARDQPAARAQTARARAEVRRPACGAGASAASVRGPDAAPHLRRNGSPATGASLSRGDDAAARAGQTSAARPAEDEGARRLGVATGTAKAVPYFFFAKAVPYFFFGGNGKAVPYFSSRAFSSRASP